MKPIAFVAIGVAAAVAGFAIYRYGIETRTASAPPEPTHAVVEGVPAPGGTAEPPPSAVPATLPDFTLADLDGKRRSILEWPGKSMVVNFWATWCAPCRREIPLLLELQKQHGSEGFQVVGVAVDFRDDVLKYVKEIGIDYPV